jgi:hypothetical protein
LQKLEHIDFGIAQGNSLAFARRRTALYRPFRHDTNIKGLGFGGIVRDAATDICRAQAESVRRLPVECVSYVGSFSQEAGADPL